MSEDLQKINTELEYWKRTENKALNALHDASSPAYQFHLGRYTLCCHLLSKIDRLTKDKQQ
jgi:hypothetical protein